MHENSEKADGHKPCITFSRKANSQHEKSQSRFKSSENIDHETIHEQKYRRLHQTADAMLKLLNHLHNEHTVHIEGIQSKVTYLMKILTVFNMFHTEVNKFSMIGSQVRMKPKVGNSIKNVILTNGLEPSNDFVRILSKKLMELVFNLKSIAKQGKRIDKRSTQLDTSIEQLKSLRVNKLHIIEHTNDSQLGLWPKKNISTTLYLSGNIKLQRLLVRILANDFKPKQKREHRAPATSLPVLDHSKIISKTVNNIALDGFIGGLFRNGINTVVNGLLQF